MAEGAARRVIRLFPDWAWDWPLWENSTPERPSKYTMEPADYGLSPELTGRLGAWQKHWAEHLEPTEGWDTAANRDTWLADGERIAADLAAEVADFADVSYEPPLS